MFVGVEMLKLVLEKKCRRAAAATARPPPQCVMLHDRLMTFGRSYKADVKIMQPYISRKHFSVSTQCLSA